MDIAPAVLDAFAEADEPTVEDVPTVDVDGRVACAKCLKTFKPLADGSVRKHKCVESIGSVAPAQARKRVSKRSAPTGVRRLCVSTLAAGTEWGASIVVSRAVPCARSEVPDAVTDLPDADTMIGPLVDQLWPTLPPGVQKTLIALSDREDLIASIFAWIEYAQNLKAWSEAEAARRVESRQQNEIVQVPSASAGIVGHSDVGGWAPFAPADETL